MYDENNNEGIEEIIRWVAESAERTQGWDFFMDWNLHTEIAQALRVIEDFYPKIPVVVLTNQPVPSFQVSSLLFEMKEYSQLLHVPSGDLVLGEVPIGVEVISHQYRSFAFNSMSQFLMPLLVWPEETWLNWESTKETQIGLGLKV